MIPVERAEALALTMMAKGEGTHAVEGFPELEDAVVRFVPGDLGSVEVVLRSEGKPQHQFRFRVASPASPHEKTRAAKPKKKAPEIDIARLVRETEERPEDAAAWNSLGCALAGAGKHEEALPALERALAIEPGNPFYRLEVGLAHGQLGRNHDAEKHLDFVASFDRNLENYTSHPGVAALLNLAFAQSLQGDNAKAIETLRPAAALAATILRDMGRYAMDAGRQAEAAKYFAASAGAAPANEETLHGAGRSLLWIGKTEESIPWLTEAVAAGPACVSAWYDLGLALSRLGRRAAARRMFRKALKRDPKHRWSWYDLGCLDALDGKPDAAFRKLFRAAKCGLNGVPHASIDPDLVALRKDPRWPKLVAAMQRANGCGEPAV